MLVEARYWLYLRSINVCSADSSIWKQLHDTQVLAPYQEKGDAFYYLFPILVARGYTILHQKSNEFQCNGNIINLRNQKKQ